MLAQQILTIFYHQGLLPLKKTSKLIGFFTECKQEGKLNKEYTQRLILSTDQVYGSKSLSGFSNTMNLSICQSLNGLFFIY